MKNTIPYSKILTDEDLMETLLHGSSSYPFHFYNENLAQFDFHCVEWHWHAELEFVYIESGVVTFWGGEKKFVLSQGDGVFINTRILHRMYSPAEAAIPNFLCMPSFIAPQDSFLYQKYILPVISSTLDFQIFHEKVPWQAEALSIMKQIIEAQERTLSAELMTASLMQRLWLEIYENVSVSHKEESRKNSASSQARLQLMMQYIHLNYSQDISLEDIADYAGISKSTVLNFFHNYLHITPINYLIKYRLNEAAVLLSNTEKKVRVVSEETGFHNVDYFCRLFKKHYHVTPTEYRKKKKK